MPDNRTMLEIGAVVLLIVVAAGVVHILQHARKRLDGTTRRAMILIAGVSVVVVVLVGVPVWYTAQRRFDSATWRAAIGDGGPERRCKMVDDLLEHHLFPGMTISDVRALLGTPGIYPAHMPDEPSRFIYRFGDCGRFLAIDELFLVIEFDAAGTMTASYTEHTD